MIAGRVLIVEGRRRILSHLNFYRNARLQFIVVSGILVMRLSMSAVLHSVLQRLNNGSELASRGTGQEIGPGGKKTKPGSGQNFCFKTLQKPDPGWLFGSEIFWEVESDPDPNRIENGGSGQPHCAIRGSGRPAFFSGELKFRWDQVQTVIQTQRSKGRSAQPPATNWRSSSLDSRADP